MKECTRVSEWIPYLQAAPNKSHRGNEWIFRINPHKADKTEDGRYKCVYGSVKAVERVLKRAHKTFKWSDDWHFSRVDLCFDANLPYAETSKLTRLLLMMFAYENGLNNRYYSIDPLMNIERTFKVTNRIDWKTPKVLEAEHYDREQKDQNDFDTQIINRLELRMEGDRIKEDARQNLRTATRQLIDKLREAITEQTLNGVVEWCTEGVYRQWLDVRAAGGIERLPTFVKSNPNKVYTLQQVAGMFAENGANNPEQDAYNLKRRFQGELFNLTDLVAYGKLLKKAAAQFLSH